MDLDARRTPSIHDLVNLPTFHALEVPGPFGNDGKWSWSWEYGSGQVDVDGWIECGRSPRCRFPRMPQRCRHYCYTAGESLAILADTCGTSPTAARDSIIEQNGRSNSISSLPCCRSPSLTMSLLPSSLRLGRIAAPGLKHHARQYATLFENQPQRPDVHTVLPGPLSVDGRAKLGRVFDTGAMRMLVDYERSQGN